MRVSGVILRRSSSTTSCTSRRGSRHVPTLCGREEVFTCYAYDNLVSGLANPLVGSFYVVAQIFLGLHLTHGFWSMTRTLGQGNPRFDKPARTIASVLGVIITIGNCSIPVAIMAGIVS